MTNRHWTARSLALLLCTALVIAPVEAQRTCPIPQPKSTIGGTNESTAGGQGRLFDLRRVPDAERYDAVSRLKKEDIPLVSRELLADRAFVEHLSHARPGVVILESSAGLDARQQLAKPIIGITVVSGVPADAAQLRHVYGAAAPMSKAALRQAEQATKKAARLPRARVDGSLAETTLREVRRTDTTAALVVLAHNDAGTLHFPDGSVLPIADFRAAADRSGRPEVLVSCETAAFLHHSLAGLGTTKRIDFANAADAIGAAQRAHTIGEFVTSFASHYKSPQSQMQNRLLVILAVGVLLVIIAIILGDDDDRKIAAGA